MFLKSRIFFLFIFFVLSANGRYLSNVLSVGIWHRSSSQMMVCIWNSKAGMCPLMILSYILSNPRAQTFQWATMFWFIPRKYIFAWKFLGFKALGMIICWSYFLEERRRSQVLRHLYSVLATLATLGDCWGIIWFQNWKTARARSPQKVNKRGREEEM